MPIRGQPETLVLYDAECAVCRLTVRIIRRLDWRHRLTFRPLQSFVSDAPDDPRKGALRRALHVRDMGGRWHRGGAAALVVAGSVPALVPLAILGRLPGMHGPLEEAYRLVADHRRAIARLLRLG